MPRWAAKTDANHVEVVKAFKALGFSVQDTSKVGGSFPDLVVGRYGVTWLVEVKTETGKLKPGQRKFFDDWRGSPPVVIRSAADAVLFAQRQGFKSEKA